MRDLRWRKCAFRHAGWHRVHRGTSFKDAAQVLSSSGGGFENATWENFKNAALSVTLSDGSERARYEGRLVLNGVVPYITDSWKGKIDQALTDVAAYAKAGLSGRQVNAWKTAVRFI